MRIRLTIVLVGFLYVLVLDTILIRACSREHPVADCIRQEVRYFTNLTLGWLKFL